MLGEGVRREAWVTVLLGTGRSLRPVQRLDFGCRESEQEILGEALGVTLDLFVEALGGDTVEGSEFGVQGDQVPDTDL